MNIQQTASTPKLVTMIPADPQMTERDIRNKHLRIAPYCRVSTDKKEQLSSYEAQIEYYTEKINANPDWTLVRLYADEGITGSQDEAHGPKSGAGKGTARRGGLREQAGRT